MSTPATAAQLCSLELQRIAARTRNLAHARDRDSRIAALRGLLVAAIASALVVLPLARLLRGTDAVVPQEDLGLVALLTALFGLLALADGFRRTAFADRDPDLPLARYLRVAGTQPHARAARLAMRAAALSVGIAPLVVLPAAPLTDRYPAANRGAFLLIAAALFLVGQAAGALHAGIRRRPLRGVAPAIGVTLIATLSLAWVEHLPPVREALGDLRLGDSLFSSIEFLLATPAVPVGLWAIAIGAAFLALRTAEAKHAAFPAGRSAAEIRLPGRSFRIAPTPLASLRRRDLARIANRLRSEPVLIAAAFVPGTLIHVAMASEGGAAVASEISGFVRTIMPLFVLLLPALLASEALWSADDRTAWSYGRAVGVVDADFLRARAGVLALMFSVGFVLGIPVFAAVRTPIGPLAGYVLASATAVITSTAAALLGGALALRWGGDARASKVPRYAAAIAGLILPPLLSIWLPAWALLLAAGAAAAAAFQLGLAVLRRAEPGPIKPAT